MTIEQDYKNFLLDIGNQQKMFEKKMAEFESLKSKISELEDKADTCPKSREKLLKLNFFRESEMPSLEAVLREKITQLERKFSEIKNAIVPSSETKLLATEEHQQPQKISKKFNRNFL